MVLVELREEETCLLPAGSVGPQQLLSLYRLYGKQFQIQPSNPLAPESLSIRSRGYVGQVRCGGDLVVRILPKVPLANLMALLEWAYNIDDLTFFPDNIESDRTDALFEFLAQRLARGVQARLRAGLWRGYQPLRGDLAYGRGRLIGPGQRPLTLEWHYQHNTVEVEENHILSWTLAQLSRMVLLPGSRELVGGVARWIARQVPPAPIAASTCLGRTYDRFNRDYQALHRLCHFFLEGCGPILAAGKYPFNGYLLHMPTLFERFAAGWLSRKLSARWLVRQQHRLPLSGGRGMAFRVDLLIEARDSGRPVAVLDTKYKRSAAFEEADIQQVVAYAVRSGTKLAYLVYPAPMAPRLDLEVGGIKVRSLHLDLGAELPWGGEELLLSLSAELAGAGGD